MTNRLLLCLFLFCAESVSLGNRVVHRSAGSTLLVGLVEWWPLSESSGTRAGVIAGLNLADNNGVTGGAGQNGSLASEFNPLGPDFLSHASQAELNPSGSFTFCASVYVNEAGASGSRTVLAKYNVQTGENSYMLAVNARVVQFYALTGPSGAGQVVVSASNFGNLSGDTWYNIFAWFDSGSGQIGVTVNAATPNTASFTGPVYASTADFRVGEWQHTGGPRPMWGRLQRIGLWSRVLTSLERAEIYNGGDGIDYPF